MSKSLYQTNVESRAPLTTDVGVVGNWWVDTSVTPADLYLCTDATGGVYTWTKQGGGVKQDTSATSITTLYSALNSLITAGHQILNIEFTANSQVVATLNRYYTTSLTTPNFEYSQQNEILFEADHKYILPLSVINNNNRFYFSFESTTLHGLGTIEIVSTNAYRHLTAAQGTAGTLKIHEGTATITTSLNNGVTSYIINYI